MEIITLYLEIGKDSTFNRNTQNRIVFRVGNPLSGL
jgi:hypothetical protein